MHNASFAATDQNYLYVPLDIAPERLSEAVKGISYAGFRGFNVTMPHKERMAELMDDLDVAAEVSGAVNTVIVSEQGRHLTGLNTDGGGFVEAASEAGISLSGRSILVLGAGGAAAAVCAALVEAGCLEVRIANRTPERAGRLVARILERFPEARIGFHPYEKLESAVEGANVIVNTTYLGMKDADELPLPGRLLGPEVAVCDAVYRRDARTRLVRAALDAGCSVMEGSRMLLYQGVLAQRTWTGVEPDVEAMSRALREAGRPEAR